MLPGRVLELQLIGRFDDQYPLQSDFLFGSQLAPRAQSTAPSLCQQRFI